jgi:hypothetical protein
MKKTFILAAILTVFTMYAPPMVQSAYAWEDSGDGYDTNGVDSNGYDRQGNRSDNPVVVTSPSQDNSGSSDTDDRTLTPAPVRQVE